VAQWAPVVEALRHSHPLAEVYSVRAGAWSVCVWSVCMVLSSVHDRQPSLSRPSPSLCNSHMMVLALGLLQVKWRATCVADFAKKAVQWVTVVGMIDNPWGHAK
jgi:hypothetical protein